MNPPMAAVLLRPCPGCSPSCCAVCQGSPCASHPQCPPMAVVLPRPCPGCSPSLCALCQGSLSASHPQCPPVCSVLLVPPHCPPCRGCFPSCSALCQGSPSASHPQCPPMAAVLPRLCPGSSHPAVHCARAPSVPPVVLLWGTTAQLPHRRPE